jgi:DNA-binding CsgD family transcriptional regulator
LRASKFGHSNSTHICRYRSSKETTSNLFAFNLNEISTTFHKPVSLKHLQEPSMDHPVAVYSEAPITLGETNLLTTRQRQPITLREKNLLTTRQRQIFDLIVVGTSNKEIARELSLSEGTVKIHIAKLFRKLGVHRRAGVALAAASLGLQPSFVMAAAVAAVR